MSCIKAKNCHRTIGIAAFLASVWIGSASKTVAEDALWSSRTAGPATYLIIPRPLPKHVGKHLPYSTTQQPVETPLFETRPATPYAYGWFGPKASPQWSRHFGYHRRYTQWSLK